MRPAKLFGIRLALVSAIILAMSWTFEAATKPDAAALYKERCSMCHGVDGKGFSAIKSQDFTDPKWQASVKDAELLDAIKKGKKGTPMIGFSDKLKEDEIRALVTYIRKLNPKKK